MKQIATKYGCSPASIFYRLHKMGIKTRAVKDYLTGRKRPEWMREVIGNAHRGKKLSKEQCQKISESRKKLKLRSPNWRGGKRTKRADGYIQVYVPEHPFASDEGYVMEHRLVMEKKLGRYLKSEEIVHHKNGRRNDNREENLELFENIGSHTAYHAKKRREKKIA